ncbi:DUF1293 family protein [Vibrio vulnificus]|uniref:DUF1293 family protein n=1 Tax=Vibrio vulnificus TaxID=672 RepID=UPI001A1C26A3|nr:DUF1293 family protein [Vibrio vulnificus]MCJ0820144.1 DUF1293 family protein [Vibrio vulnificus]HAS6132133.1 DUF1293 domain-containing protein [Vibrio vulnificus]HAS6181875.1 DUF1293 domain-containing protein [Vibrio vulnificus]HDY7617532.1 DUF1293 family protein [Vibrio vulnificus]HDY7931370.1 DUF1293 family protein [Vibrio vulnificus]
MSFCIHGIKKTVFKNSGSMVFELYIGRAVTDFENDTVHISGAGFFDTVSEFEKKRGVEHRRLEPDYAARLLSSGAFVPYKQYDFKVAPDPQDPLKDVVVELVPVDEEIKRHFAQALALKGAK